MDILAQWQHDKFMTDVQNFADDPAGVLDDGQRQTENDWQQAAQRYVSDLQYIGSIIGLDFWTVLQSEATPYEVQRLAEDYGCVQQH